MHALVPLLVQVRIFYPSNCKKKAGNRAAHRHSRGVCTSERGQAGRQAGPRTYQLADTDSVLHECIAIARIAAAGSHAGASKPPPSMRATAEQTVSTHQRGYTHCGTCSRGQAPHAHSSPLHRMNCDQRTVIHKSMGH